MKKVIGLVLTLLFISTISVDAGCYWNDQDRDCCEIGIMYCAPEAGVDCGAEQL